MSNDHLTDIAYRHFIESVKDYAIYMLSTDGTVISWNEGARRAKGYLSDEIIGCYFGLFYSEAEQLSGVPAKNLEIALRSGQFEGGRLALPQRRLPILGACHDRYHPR